MTEPIKIQIDVLSGWLAIIESALRPMVQYDLDHSVMEKEAFEIRAQALGQLKREIGDLIPF